MIWLIDSYNRKARRSQEEPGGARRGQARRGQEEPGGARRSQEVFFFARRGLGKVRSGISCSVLVLV